MIARWFAACMVVWAVIASVLYFVYGPPPSAWQWVVVAGLFVAYRYTMEAIDAWSKR